MATLLVFLGSLLTPTLVLAAPREGTGAGGEAAPGTDPSAGPVLTAAAEETSPGKKFIQWIADYPSRFVRRIVPKQEILDDPDTLQEHFDTVSAATFDGNETRRDEESNVLRPIKQVGLNILDGQIGTIRQFLAYQSAQVLYKYGQPAMQATWKQAGKVMAAVGASKSASLQKGLMSGGFGRLLAKLVPSQKLKGFAKREGNFALMAVISVLINSGVYDGLQVDEMKDHVVAIGSFAADHTYSRSIPSDILTAFMSREFYRIFQTSFDQLYGQALASKSKWMLAFDKLNKTVEAGSARLMAVNRIKDGAQAAGKQGFAKKIGLVGVGEGVKFSLKELAQRAVVGAGFAMVGDMGIEAVAGVIKGYQNRTYLGGNRHKYYARADTNTYRLQRTGNPIKDWLRERARVLEDVWDNRVKWPLRSFLTPISTFVGGYMGSVLAGILFAGGAGALVGGTLVSAALAGIGMFFGNWLSTKLDRSKRMMAFRRGNYERMIKKEIKEMPLYKQGKLSDEDVERIAKDRARDFEKLEMVGQTPNKMFIVDSLDNVIVARDGDYYRMKIPDEHGLYTTKVAHTRYDVIDIEGNRGVFDLRQGKLVSVGKIAHNNGKAICFVNGARATVENGVLVNSASSPIHIFKNGIILEYQEEEMPNQSAAYRMKLKQERLEQAKLAAERGEEPEEYQAQWVVRGHASTYDIFFRETGERFALGEDGRFHRVEAPSSAALSTATRPSQGPILAAYVPILEEAPDDELKLAVVRQSQLEVEKARLAVDARIGLVQDEESLETFIRTVRMEESDPELAGSLRAAAADPASVQNILRRRLQSFVDKMGRALGQTLSGADAGVLRTGFSQAVEAARAAASEIAGGELVDPYVQRLRVVEQSPFWGTLELLGRDDTLARAAFDPDLFRASE